MGARARRHHDRHGFDRRGGRHREGQRLHAPIVTSREDIAKRVREITDGKGVPVVYDSVGKDTLMASLDSFQRRGALVSNGTSSGSVVIDTQLLAVKGSIWMTASMSDWATR